MIIISSFLLVTEVQGKSLSISDGVLIMVEPNKTTYGEYDDMTTNCADFANVLRIGGYLVFLVKIILPLLLICKSSFNLISVVTNGKPEELKKNANKLLISCIAAIVIFFVPTIVNTIFGFIEGFNEGKTSDSLICSECVFNPLGETCKQYAEGSGD